MSRIIYAFYDVTRFNAYELVNTAVPLDNEGEPVEVQTECAEDEKFIDHPVSEQRNGLTVMLLGDLLHRAESSIEYFLESITAGDANRVRSRVPDGMFLRP